MLSSSCILVTLKFAAGQQVCRPSRAKLGIKDWAISKMDKIFTHMVAKIHTGVFIYSILAEL
jgi:hypothetical protein